MASIGLIFAGAVLVINGIAMLGGVSPRGSAIMNLFVGTMQILFPTITLLTGDGSSQTLWDASGIYLFGFTFLYVGINNLLNNDGRGLGWYSIFVFGMALLHAYYVSSSDPVFTIIWLVWALMWLLFFLILVQKRVTLVPFTGWLLALGGFTTCTTPGVLLIKNHWFTDATAGIIAGVAAVALITASIILGRIRPSLAPVEG